MGKLSDNLNTGEASTRLSRRKFLTGTSGAAVSLSILRPELIRGSQANPLGDPPALPGWQ
jgi:hypothetical protein